MAETPGEWIHERTLGGHRGEFWWRLTADGSLSLLLLRSTAGRLRRMVRRFSAEELEQLLGFMSDGAWHALVTSNRGITSKLPPDGIGVFLHHGLGRPTTEARLATHLAAVLARAGLWESDGRKTKIRFRQVATDRGRLAAYFESRQEEPGPRLPEDFEAPLAPRAQAAARHPGFSLADSWHGRTRALQGELQAIEGGRHTVSKGQRRENAFRDLLRRYLPTRCSLGAGEVAEPSGTMSRQVDVLVYDGLDQEPLVDDPGSLVLAAESVYAAIEIKPLLDGSHLDRGADIVRSVKVLPRTALDRAVVRDGKQAPQANPPPFGAILNPPPFGAILACHSTDPDQLALRLRAFQDGKPPPNWVDAVCILDTAVIHRFTGMLGPDGWTLDCYEEAVHYAVVDTGTDSLLYFLDLLRADLRQKRLWPYQLASYSSGITFDEPRIV